MQLGSEMHVESHYSAHAMGSTFVTIDKEHGFWVTDGFLELIDGKITERKLGLP